MAIYEFYCRKCKREFEVERSVSSYDATKIRCPKCKGKQVERRWTSVFAVTSKKS